MRKNEYSIREIDIALWRSIQFYSGIVTGISLVLTIIGGMIAPTIQPEVCYGPCDPLTWEDIYEEGSFLYMMGPVGEFMKLWFFVIFVIGIIVTIIASGIIWFNRSISYD